MAASTTNRTTFIPDFEAATQRAVQANERFADAGRKAVAVYLDGVEKYVGGVTQFERKLAGQSQVDAVTELLTAHAQLTEDLSKAGVKAARELIAA
jgi:hypothetical protein